ncbi:hypothetical protein PMAYCL1PPCAC_24800, partial [Pristionchus mayeri]
MPPPTKKVKEISSSPPDGTVRIEMEKVSSIREESIIYSTGVNVRGVSWKGQVVRGGTRDLSTLFATLHCLPNQSTPWSVDVDSVFILLNSDPCKNVEEKCSRSHLFCGMEDDDDDYICSGIRGITFKEIIDENKGFLKDDKVIVEVRFWIYNMTGFRDVPRFDFTDPNEPLHDVALLINGEKIYASKQILASHSPVFKAMFYGNFSEKKEKEIELKEVNREVSFDVMIDIHTAYLTHSDVSAEFLLKLGDRFQIVCVIDRVEKFLINSLDVSPTQKLRIADQYNLAGLQ